jgi:cob(I)alamin adenosyltransferase
LADGSRVSKSSDLVEFLGAVDRANSFLGLAIAHLPKAHDADRERLHLVQEDLFVVGADAADSKGRLVLKEEAVRRIEAWTDELERSLPPLERFILPGGSATAAHFFVARAAVRDAERAGWFVRKSELGRAEGGAVVPREWPLVYLNRLSDLLFLLARSMNHAAQVPEPEWAGRGAQGKSSKAR